MTFISHVSASAEARAACGRGTPDETVLGRFRRANWAPPSIHLLTGLVATATPLLLTACAVGPDYHRPAPPPVAGYTVQPLPAETVDAAGQAQHFVLGADIAGEWWTLFRSPQLTSLIDQALAHNPSLAAAQQTLIEAEEDTRAEQGALLPSLSGGVSGERARASSAELGSYGSSVGSLISSTNLAPYTLYNASLNVSYSPDVFGGVRRQVESLQSQAEYENFELEASYLSLTANVVTAAVAVASYRGQIDVTTQIVAADRKLLQILRVQANLGGVPKANILSEQATLATTQATLPPLQAALAEAQNQLANYVGQFPSKFAPAVFNLSSLTLPGELPVTLPSNLVNQRPDIQASAAQLHEASANVGVATANMLPQISLSADVEHEALQTSSLFTPQTLMWSLIAQVTQPIFEGGQLSAKRKAAVAALRAAGFQYQSTVLAAFQDVSNALEVLQFDAATLRAAQQAEDMSSASLQVTQNQYRLGGEPFTAVLIAQTTYENAALSRIKAQATRLSDTAALFEALGGGWWNRADVDHDARTCCGLIP